MGYTKEAIKGISWLWFSRISTRSISYIRIAVLARLLTPSEFGAADIALLVLSITEVFTETGINIFLVQQKEKIDKYINTAWIVSIFRGILIAGIIILGAPFITKFFNAPSVSNLLLISSLVPILRGFINPSVAKFIKDLQFYKEFSYRTLVFLVEATVSVSLAFLLHSPIAIIYGLIAGAFFEILLSFIIARPIPAFYYNHSLFKDIIHNGKWITITGIFNYLYHNLDNVVVGKIFGTASLGLYQRAYSISMLPITEVSDVIGRVTFPVYVKMSEDIARLRKAYFKSILMVCLIVIPVGFVVFAFPEFVIKIVLGNQWIAAVPILKILAIFGVVRAISITSMSPFYALKRQWYVSHITLVSLLGLAITIVPFTTIWGVVGAAYSALFGTMISLPVIAFYLYRIFYK